MTSCNKSQGFTLIEVIIAMTLLSIMVALLFASMRICSESWQKGEAKIADVNDVAVVYQFFQQHLTTAKPLWDDFTEENKILSFQGHKQSLQFVSSFPASAKKAGLQLFSLKLMSEDKNNYIQVSIKPFFASAKGEEWQLEEVTLLNHVSDFSISYLNVDESQPDGFWQDEWFNMETMPKLVKIKIKRETGGFWPDMVLELKAFGTSPNADPQALSDDERAASEARAMESQ